MSRLWNGLSKDFLLTPKPRVDPTGYGQLVASEVGILPDEMSLLLGEQLYQLRSALDACIYQATIYATGENPPPNEGALEFPITDDPEEWPKLERRRLAALPDEIRKSIKKIQPFQSAQLPPEQKAHSIGWFLGILHDLARKDRHRQLHIVGSWPIDINPQFTLPRGVVVEWFKPNPPSVLTKGSVIATYQLKGFTLGMTVSLAANLKTNLGCSEPPPPCHPTDTFDVN